MNSSNEAIGLGSFFERRPYDYTKDELNLPQGHEDRIRMVDLLPIDRKLCTDVFIQLTGWSAQRKLTRLSIRVLVLGRGNAS